MTLTDLQSMVLQAIARNRDARSYVAGGAALNRDRPRLSDDLDIFHDPRADFVAAVERDIAALRAADYTVDEVVRSAGSVEVVVRRYNFETRIQWMEETERRFFPLVSDPQFGMRLHDTDLAVNKVLCAASRRRPRDVVDLVAIARDYCPLGPLVWAAAAKTHLGPGRMIEEIRATARSYAAEELRTVRMMPGSEIDPRAIRALLDGALDRAEHYILRNAPDEHPGVLYLDAAERPVEADGEMLARGGAHARPCVSFGDSLPAVPENS